MSHFLIPNNLPIHLNLPIHFLNLPTQIFNPFHRNPNLAFLLPRQFHRIVRPEYFFLCDNCLRFGHFYAATQLDTRVHVAAVHRHVLFVGFERWDLDMLWFGLGLQVGGDFYVAFF